MRLTLCLTMGVVLWGLGSDAAAQYGYGLPSDNPNGPTVSPYLNLLRNQNSGLPNYQTLVRPFIDYPAAINQNAAQINQLQQQALRTAPPTTTSRRSMFDTTGGLYNQQLRGTGHPVRYQFYSHYYTPYRRQ